MYIYIYIYIHKQINNKPKVEERTKKGEPLGRATAMLQSTPCGGESLHVFLEAFYVFVILLFLYVFFRLYMQKLK